MYGRMCHLGITFAQVLMHGIKKGKKVMPPNIFIENVPTRKESHENLYLLLLYLINTYFKI